MEADKQTDLPRQPRAILFRYQSRFSFFGESGWNLEVQTFAANVSAAEGSGGEVQAPGASRPGLFWKSILMQEYPQRQLLRCQTDGNVDDDQKRTGRCSQGSKIA